MVAHQTSNLVVAGSSPVRSGRSLLPLLLPAVGVGSVLLLFGTIAVFIGGLVVEF